MNKQIEALKMAIEAMQSAYSSHGKILPSYPAQDAWMFHGCDAKLYKSIEACKEALESQEQECKHGVDDGCCKECYMEQSQEEKRPKNAVLVPLDKLKDMQRRLSDCKEYLKEDETPAECIARNRKDAITSLEMLSKCMREKKALESQKPLSWDSIGDIGANIADLGGDIGGIEKWVQFARAIEQAHGIGVKDE